MRKGQIICNGLCCKINAKAAFVDMCLENPELSGRMLMSVMGRLEYAEKMYLTEEKKADEKTGVLTMRLELDEEKKEKIYDEVFERRLLAGGLAKLTEENRQMLEPIGILHRKEIRVDIIPFLVYGIVRNSRSRSMLEQSAAGEIEKECMDTFCDSRYNTTVFLGKFLLDERKAAKLAAGLLILLENEGDEKEDEDKDRDKDRDKEIDKDKDRDKYKERYRMVMNIIYAGYRAVKNTIKKLNCLSGEQYKESMARDQPARMELAHMVIQMVTAEDLGVPLRYDYDFCQVVCMLLDYDGSWLNDQRQELDITAGKRIYRKFLREHWNPGRFYVSAYLEEGDDNAEQFWERTEALMDQFGIGAEALAGLSLEKWESDMLCAIFEEKDWERYKYLLLVATLCKYIQQIEAMYENEIPKERDYQESSEENAVKNMEYDLRRMKEKVRSLEQQKKDMEKELAEVKRQAEHLKRDEAKWIKQHEKDREAILYWKERISLKEKKDRGEERRAAKEKIACAAEIEEPQKSGIEDGKVLDTSRLERSIVIGGHQNWQKKLRQCLPDSQFLGPDYMHFDPAVLRNKKYIIVNTDILKHGLYYKIMSERKKEQKVLYVHGNNIDRTLREIAKQL